MIAPPELTDLPLYANDTTLCTKWPIVYAAWQKAFPHVDVLAEVRAAHSWELANPAKRKKDRVRYLNNWITRAAQQTPQNTQLTQEQEKRLRFQAKYETELSPNWPGTKSHFHAETWDKVIHAIDSDTEMDAVFSFMRKHKPDNRRPLVSEFWHALRAIRAEKEETPLEACAICHGSGYIVLPARMERQPDRTMAFIFGDEHGGPLNNYAFPCRCTVGIARGRHMRISQTTKERAWDYYQDVRKSAGYQGETETMTLGEYLQKRREDQFSPNSILIDAKVASYQAAGLTKNGGIYGARGATIKAWHKRREKDEVIDAIQKACFLAKGGNASTPMPQRQASETASEGLLPAISEPPQKPPDMSNDDLPF